MQTFLPYSDFEKSARCLDNKRLGKQRVEVYQILRVLTGVTKGWANHPAVKMWKGHELALAWYGMVCCDVWLGRGYKDSLKPKLDAMALKLSGTGTYPLWFYGSIHASHRSNLLRKDPIHYGQFGWTEANNLPYVWPK